MRTFGKRFGNVCILSTSASAAFLSKPALTLSDDSDVYEKEYPIIEATHKKASDVMAGFSDGTPIEPTVLEWDAKLRDSLTEAVRAEKHRGNMQTKAIQSANANLAPQYAGGGPWAGCSVGPRSLASLMEAEWQRNRPAF